MKEKHVEAKLQEDRLDPHIREVPLERDPVFMSFWQTCIEKSSKSKDLDKLSPLLSKYTEWTWNMQNTFKEFHAFLKDIPLVVVIRHWVEGVISDKQMGEKYLKGMERLLTQDLIPLKSKTGTAILLSDVRAKGHQETIENIRCVQSWTQAEKEELVQCYVKFSCDLAKYTFDYVPAGYDPDRRVASSRLISYEVFCSFIQYLSKRDALLASVLYFGAPSMEEVLSLKIKAIDKERSCIQFNEKTELFPKRLVQDLLSYAQEHSNPTELLFANLRGEQVDRAHLNQSFARASERMPQGVKITPGSLLRFNV